MNSGAFLAQTRDSQFIAERSAELLGRLDVVQRARGLYGQESSILIARGAPPPLPARGVVLLDPPDRVAIASSVAGAAASTAFRRCRKASAKTIRRARAASVTARLAAASSSFALRRKNRTSDSIGSAPLMPRPPES